MHLMLLLLIGHGMKKVAASFAFGFDVIIIGDDVTTRRFLGIVENWS